MLPDDVDKDETRKHDGFVLNSRHHSASVDL